MSGFVPTNHSLQIGTPPRTTTVIAGILEPLAMATGYLASAQVLLGQLDLHDVLLSFLVFVIVFPGVDRFNADFRSAMVDLTARWITLLAALWACGWLTNTLELFDRQVLLIWAVVTPFILAACNVAGRTITRRSRTASTRMRSVIVGGGNLAARTVQSLKAAGDHQFQILGIFDDRDTSRATQATGLPHLGPLSDLAEYIRTHQVGKVFITLPLNSQPRIQSLIDSMGDTTAELFYVPDVFGVSIIQGRLSQMDGMPVVGLLESPFTGMNGVVKRASDIVLSLIALILASPLLLGSALAVRLSSPGPIIFRQRRHGMDGKEIMVYKFRSMVTMDNGTVVKQASRDDDRVTKVGRILRKTSLDELPQLINVLQGRMSMVGPRPHAVAHNEQYRKLITAYMVRHKVKPGITGWAQIHGHRGPTETVDKMQTRLEYDLEYLRNWSLRLDLQILVRTVTTVLFDRHAF